MTWAGYPLSVSLLDRFPSPLRSGARSVRDAAPADLVQRAKLAVYWPLGIARVLWQRLPGGPPLHRSGAAGDVGDLPADLPSGVRTAGLQGADDGIGPLLHRCYSVDIDDADIDAAALMAAMQADPNAMVPEIALFEKSRGAGGSMDVGDEFMIRMPGPWNGPVRVAEVTPTSFLLLTLDDHLEAGQIVFRAADEPDGSLRFEIESWARPGDWFSHVFYNRLWVAREVQLTLWVQTCVAVAKRSGGRLRDGVHIDTRSIDTFGGAYRRSVVDARDRFPFAFAPAVAFGLAAAGIRPDSTAVLVGPDELDVRFGRWRLVTPLANVAAAEVAGPYSAVKVYGPRLSIADRGLTFGTTTAAGVCIEFHEPVPGIEPTGLLRHPSLTVTVADPAALVDRLRDAGVPR